MVYILKKKKNETITDNIANVMNSDKVKLMFYLIEIKIFIEEKQKSKKKWFFQYWSFDYNIKDHIKEM